MKLIERFLKLYPHQTENYLDNDEAILCEKISDDFAIGFAEWFDDLSEDYCKDYTVKELLEIYKQEKGL